MSSFKEFLKYCLVNFGFYLIILILLFFSIYKIINLPIFELQNIKIHGDLKHNTIETINKQINGLNNSIYGTFFTADLNKIKNQFKEIPWIKEVKIKRDFPNSLVVELIEYEAIAFWNSKEETFMLDNEGKIFEAKLNENNEKLPLFIAQKSAEITKEMLLMYKMLNKSFNIFKVKELELDDNTWIVKFDNNLAIKLNKESEDTISFKLAKFIQDLDNLKEYNVGLDNLSSIDFRYKFAYAIKLKKSLKKLK